MAAAIATLSPLVIMGVAVAVGWRTTSRRKRAKDALAEVNSKTGTFERTASIHRHFVRADGSSPYPAEAGRYHLVVSLACPWAARVLTVRALKGLEDAIAVSVVHPTWQKSKPDDPADAHWGWAFSPDQTFALANANGAGALVADGTCTSDGTSALAASGGARAVRDLYEAAGSGATKFTVPLLWDTHTRTIVSNESSELVRMLNAEFNSVATRADLDLYPLTLREEIDATNKWVYEGINNGVYRCGFATSQQAYDEAIAALCTSLDRAEWLLNSRRYLAGDQLTEADVRLYQTLVRFDEVYVVYFKCNVRPISSYPNLHHYLRELYQVPAFRAATNMWHIKTHYFTSHAKLNPHAIVPRGPGVLDDLVLPHDRERLPGAALV